MKLIKVEGVILQTLNFRDYDRILTVFTRENGLLKMIVPQANRGRQKNSLEPLVKSEFVLLPAKSDLFRCQEAIVVQRYARLRNSYVCLESACDLLKAIQESQLAHIPAPKLYQLLDYYLDRLPEVPDPQLLAASFRLKILKHDGLFHCSAVCTVCHQGLDTMAIIAGEGFCHQHAPKDAQVFSSEEIALISLLSLSQSLREMIQQNMTKNLYQKIQLLFTQCLFH